MSAVMLAKHVVDDIEQLRGKKACFPLFDGYGNIENYLNLRAISLSTKINQNVCCLVWNSFLSTLKLENIERTPTNGTIKSFFGDKNICAILSSDQNSIPECDFDGKVNIYSTNM